MMLDPAVMPTAPTMHHSTSLPNLSSSSSSSPSLPAASARLHDDKLDKEMNDFQSDSPTITSPNKRRVNKRTEEDLAETVMNWDIGTEIRGTKRKPQTEEPEKEVKELVVKLQKLSHDVHKVDGVRIVHVKFAPGVILKAKKLFQGIYFITTSTLSFHVSFNYLSYSHVGNEVKPYGTNPLLHHSLALYE